MHLRSHLSMSMLPKRKVGRICRLFPQEMIDTLPGLMSNSEFPSHGGAEDPQACNDLPQKQLCFADEIVSLIPQRFPRVK